MSIVLDDANKGRGTLGKLLKDSVLYQDLDRAVLDLDLLSWESNIFFALIAIFS